MEKFLALERGLSKFKPLGTILTYDDFDNGANGWVDLTPNFRFENFQPLKGSVDLTNWGPAMLSSATFSRVGTHGSMEGIYSLKLATRPVAAPFTERPKSGSMSQALKRISTHTDAELLQFEMWYTYKPEQDRPGFSEKDIRAFGFLWDIQDESYRFMPSIRYVNSIDGNLKQQWYYAHAPNATAQEWRYGAPEGWHKAGVDYQWFGRRYEDGHTDGFQEVPEGHQKLCYNESDDKINWLYFRLLFDLHKREYIELQSEKRIFYLRGRAPTLVEAYANIEALLNASVWIETDTDRRAFFYVDSAVISVE
jgi:hypothetical protein